MLLSFDLSSFSWSAGCLTIASAARSTPQRVTCQDGRLLRLDGDEQRRMSR